MPPKKSAKPSTVKKAAVGKKASKISKKEAAKRHREEQSEDEESDSPPQMARRSVKFRAELVAGQKDQPSPKKQIASESVAVSKDVEKVMANVGTMTSGHDLAAKILDDVGDEMEKEKMEALSAPLERPKPPNQQTSRPESTKPPSILKTTKAPIMPLERAGNAAQIFDGIFADMMKQNNQASVELRLRPKTSTTQQPKKISLIDGYPPAPGAGQKAAPPSGAYDRHGNGFGEKPAYKPTTGDATAQKLAYLEKKSSAAEANLQKTQSELLNSVLPAFGPFRCDRAVLDHVVKTGQWDELKGFVTQKRVEYENVANELKFEAAEWKTKFQQEQQKVTEIKKLVDLLSAKFAIPAPAPEFKPKPSNGENFSTPPSTPRVHFSQPIGSRGPILSNPATCNDESAFQTPAISTPSYMQTPLGIGRGSNVSRPFPPNRGRYISRRPFQYATSSRFNRGRPFGRGGFNDREYPPQRPYNGGPGYGADQGEMKRPRVEYNDLELQDEGFAFE